LDSIELRKNDCNPQKNTGWCNTKGFAMLPAKAVPARQGEWPRTRDETVTDSQQYFPVRLTQAQRKVVAEIAPELANRLDLDERNQRTIPFTLAELKAIKAKAGAAAGKADSGMVRNSLRHVTDLRREECGGRGTVS
jgi:hypothetical protein